jgi:CHAD domain-containing protein
MRESVESASTQKSKTVSRQNAMALDQDKIRKTIRRLGQSLDRKSQWRSPEKVHDLRTRSRRLETVMRALMVDQKQSGHRLLKTVARIFSQAGKVRDMDVLAAFASGVAIVGHDPCLAQLLEHLHEKRQKSAVKLRACIAKHGKAARRGLKQCSARLQSNSEATDVQRLQSNATSFASQLCGELAAWTHLTVANMHEYRLKLKELRYTLQMAEGNDTPFVSMLGEITAAIGEWHDWTKLLAIATEVLQRSPNCAVLKAIRSTVSAKRHHALFLANTMRKEYLGAGSHTPHKLRKTTLSEPVLGVIATLASRSSSEPRIS